MEPMQRGGWRAFIRRLTARTTKPARTIGSQILQLGALASGAHVDEREALRISAVWRCVSLIADSIALLPWTVYRRSADGNSTHLPAHPISWLLNHEPNVEQTAYQFRQTLVAHRLIYGNAYAEIERNARGEPIAMWTIEPERVRPFRDVNGRLAYAISNETAGTSVLPPRDIFHVAGLSHDGVCGHSIVEVAAQSLGIPIALDRFAAAFFGRGMRPSAVITAPTGLTQTALDQLTQTIQAWQGGKKSHMPLLLDNGMKWDSIQTQPDEAQMLESRKFAVTEVCRWFGVPPHLVFDLEKSTQRNIEEQGREFLRFGLMPQIVPLEQQANKKLLTSGWGGLYSQMNVNEYRRGDLAARAAYYQQMRAMGVLSVNDIRRDEGMDTIGPEGDIRVMQMQYVDITTQLEREAPEAGEPIDEPENEDEDDGD